VLSQGHTTQSFAGLGEIGPLPLVQTQSPGHASLSSLNPATPGSVAVCGVHRLAPREVVERIVHSWFDLIHSLAPIFHRGMFLARLATDECTQDGIFAALVVSMCAATLVSLPRKSYQDFGPLTAEQCWDVIDDINLHQRREPYTLEWCQMKYNIGSSQYACNNALAFRNTSEAAAGVKYLIYHEMAKKDFVSQQLLKRLYWLLFAGGW